MNIHLRTVLEALSHGPTSSCIEWPGIQDRWGYGRFRIYGEKRTSIVAHRAVYEASLGPIPAGLQLDHLCRNRSCVNPAHLEPVTPRENTIRAFSSAAGLDTRVQCRRGHLRSAENIYTAPDGRPTCRPCNAESARRSAAKRRNALAGVAS